MTTEKTYTNAQVKVHLLRAEYQWDSYTYVDSTGRVVATFGTNDDANRIAWLRSQGFATGEYPYEYIEGVT